MARYSDIVTDNGTPGIPLAGAFVTVLDSSGLLAFITDDFGIPILQPMKLGSLGVLEFNIPDPGDTLTLQYRYGARLVREDLEIVGQPAAFKGDPGGNTMAIGLFGGAYQMNIPVGTDAVRTSGYSVAGKGISTYAYDPAVNVAYVAANPRTSFMTANGRGFRFAETQISHHQIGALGDGIADDTLAIGAGLAHMMAHRIPLYTPTGRYVMTQQLVVDLASVFDVGFMWTGDAEHLSVLDFRGLTVSPNFLLTCSRTPGDCSYPNMLGIGMIGDVNGRLAQFGKDDFSDPINKPLFRIGIQNFNTMTVGTSAVAAVFNYVLGGDLLVQINGGNGGYMGGYGNAIIGRQCLFNTWRGSAGTASVAHYYIDGVNVGNVHLAMDYENVSYCVLAGDVRVQNNTWLGGQWSYSSAGFRAIGGSSNIVDAPNLAPNSPATAAGFLSTDAYYGVTIRGKPPGFTTPTLPPTNTAVVNNTGRDCVIVLFGAVTSLVIGGFTHPANNGVAETTVLAGESVTPNYTGSSAWQWRSL